LSSARGESKPQLLDVRSFRVPPRVGFGCRPLAQGYRWAVNASGSSRWTSAEDHELIATCRFCSSTSGDRAGKPPVGERGVVDHEGVHPFPPERTTTVASAPGASAECSKSNVRINPRPSNVRVSRAPSGETVPPWHRAERDHALGPASSNAGETRHVNLLPLVHAATSCALRRVRPERAQAGQFVVCRPTPRCSNGRTAATAPATRRHVLPSQ